VPSLHITIPEVGLAIDLPNTFLHFSNMTTSWQSLWKDRARIRRGPQYGTVQCEAGWRWDVSRMTDFDLWVAFEGRGTMAIGDREFSIGPGFRICFPPGEYEIHASHDPDHPLKVLYCHFQTDQPIQPPLPPQPRGDPPDRFLQGALSQLSANLADQGPDSLTECLLWQVLLTLEAEPRTAADSPRERVRSVVRHLRENPAGNPGVDQLAAQAGLSSGHFRRLFREITGQSPLDFTISQRIERACFYLQESSLPVKQVAFTLGYRDIFFFSRQFRERTGYSPGAWRRTYRT
jgi:AraC-like DNA-binding protein